jgi:hypothetical protein
MSFLAIVTHGELIIEVSFDSLLQRRTNLAVENRELHLVDHSVTIIIILSHLQHIILTEWLLNCHLTLSVQNHTEGKSIRIGFDVEILAGECLIIRIVHIECLRVLIKHRHPFISLSLHEIFRLVNKEN